MIVGGLAVLCRLTTPYRASHAIFVREGADTAFEAVDTIPEVLIIRAFLDNGAPIVPIFFDEAGHRVATQYLLSVLEGAMPAEKLLHYREFNEKLPGHPELGLTPGVKFSSGRLGHIWSMCNGVAMAHPDKAVIVGQFQVGGHTTNINDDPAFKAEFDYLLKHYVGRPSPLWFAERLTDLIPPTFYRMRHVVPRARLAGREREMPALDCRHFAGGLRNSRPAQEKTWTHAYRSSLRLQPLCLSPPAPDSRRRRPRDPCRSVWSR